MRSLPVVNLAETKFECLYGRGCEGLCCQHARPQLRPDEAKRLNANVERFLPHLRPEAQAIVKKIGYADGRSRPDQPILRVVKTWCVFFNKGCVLQRVGMAEGDKNKYKPRDCSLFPLAQDEGDWYVRQRGYRGEIWELPCLEPNRTTVPAAESLKEEIKYARKITMQANGD